MDDTIEALKNPKHGMCFHKQYSYWVYILDVTESCVLYVGYSDEEHFEVKCLNRFSFFEKHTDKGAITSWLTLEKCSDKRKQIMFRIIADRF